MTLCEADNDIDHEILSDHLYDLDHLDDLHDINNFDDNKVIHRVELVQHNGNAMTNYASTSHTNEKTNNELYTNTMPIIQQSNVPTAFTKVVEQTVIQQSNNDGNNSPEANLSMKDVLYRNKKMNENGIGNGEKINLLPIPSQPASDIQGNMKNIIHTTVTKTTSGSPSNELNDSFNKINNLDALSTMSSANSNYNDGIAGSSSSQSNSMDENSKTKTISTIENIIDGSGFDNSKRLFRTPGNSFRRMKTTIIQQHNINDSNDRSVLGKSTIGFNRENTSLGYNTPNPLEYNTVTTTTVDRDNNIFNKGISSRRQQTSFNKFNALGNLVSDNEALQNPSSIVQTKTTIIKNGRPAEDIKLGDSNDKKIDYNVDDRMSTSNNIVSSMTIPLAETTATVDKDSVFNKGISSWTQQTNFNKFNKLGNLMSETGALQNPGSFVKTKTTLIKNNKAEDEIKLDDLNNSNIDYNVDDGMSATNNIVNLNYGTKSSNNIGNDNTSGYSYSYNFGNGMGVGDYNNIGDIVSSSHLMDGSLSGGYSSYMSLPTGCNKGNGKRKKIKKNGSTTKFIGSRSKNISYGKNKGNGQIRVKNGRNYKNTRSSKNRSGGNNSSVRRGTNRSFSSSSSSSNESSMKTKKSCHCNNGRKLNKRDSSESHESSNSKEHSGLLINYLGSSMDNQPMQNNDDFVARFLPPLPPFMKREPQSNLLFGLIPGQRPDQSLNYSQSDLRTALDRLEKTRSQPINDHQLSNIDVSNQYLSYQIPNTGSLFKSDSQQRQFFGPLGRGLGLGTEQGPGHDSGPQANPFDFKPYFVGDYPKYLEQNLQPSPLSQPPFPYSFDQDFYSDISKTGLTLPKFTDFQSGQDNQINILYTDIPQMQQEIEGTNRMDALNSGSMTTRSQSPIIQYFKTIKTENIDGNGIPDIVRSVQTQSVPPKVDGNYIM